MSEYKLASEIVARSVATNWDEAKLEWELASIYESDEAETCLCGHYPIIELCELVNRKNHKFATVGNCCVKKFLGIRSDKIFSALKRVRKDIQRSLNAETIELAYQQGWIDDWDWRFYFDTMRKRLLSTKQAAHRRRINKNILEHITNQMPKKQA